MSSRLPDLESTDAASLSAPDLTRATRPRRWPRRVARIALALLAATWLLLVVGWLSLHWLILPHIERWREPLEAQASRVVGAPVRFARIEVTSSGWIPAISLGDVKVLDAQQRTALVLPRVSLALSPRSLLALDLRFAQIHIEGAQLDVRRDVRGRIFVAGLDVDGASPGGGIDSEVGVADWFFRQREFVIRHGTLRWIDEARQAPPLALREVDVVVRNGVRGHDVRIDATPPADWGDRFTLRGRFTQPLFAAAGDWRRWSGEGYVELPRADLRQLGRHVTLPFALAEGDGAMRGWLRWHEGHPERATVDVALRAVALRLAPELDPLAFAEIQGRVVAEREPSRRGDRTRIEVENFGFVTGDGARWPAGRLALAWRERPDDASPGAAVSALSIASAASAATSTDTAVLNLADITGGEFSADRLDIGVMASIAGGLPLGTPLRRLLADVAPRGTVRDLKASWQGPLDAPTGYRVGATLEDLALAAHAAEGDAVGRPGLEHARLRLDADERGGTAQVGITDGVLILPGVFADPDLRVDRFDARLAWQVESRAGQPWQARVQVDGASFANADARGDFTARWQSGGVGVAAGADRDRFPGQLVLDGRVAEADAARVARYLPLGLPADVRDYVQRAVRKGRVRDLRVHLAGDLRHVPFLHATPGGNGPRDGEFRIAGHVDDLEFAFLPSDRAWPALAQVSADLVFDRASLAIRDGRLRFDGTEWKQVQGGIASVVDKPRLEVSGSTRAPLAEMLRIVAATPVGHWLGGALEGASGTGAADLRLALGLPLTPEAEQHAPSAVKGNLVLPGNDLRMRPDLPLFAGTRGKVDFTEAGFTVPPATARTLGGDITFEGGQAPHGAVRFSAEGTATAEAMRRAGELGVLARLAGAVEGQAAYRATLAFPDGHAQFGVTSNLVGMTIALPAPLAKPAGAALPLVVRTNAEPGGESGSARSGARTDTLWVGLGPLLQARVVRDAAGERVLRGLVQVDATPGRSATPAATPQSLRLPAKGLSVEVEADRLAVDAWQAAASRLFDKPAAATTGTAPTATASTPADANGWWPASVSLRARELEVGGRKLSDVKLAATRTAGVAAGAAAGVEGERWRANVRADQLEGYVEYSPAVHGRGAGGVYARLSRLSIPRGEADPTENLLDRPPDSVPSLDIVVDAFELRGKQLGRLEAEAANRDRKWELRRFSLSMPEAKLSATGSWQPGSSRRAAMDFTLDLDDGGAFLERLGMGRVVKGGSGRFDGFVEWPGSPLSPDVARMNGRIKVAIRQGQFLKANPGAARLLGILSLQSLPRRLLLDFRDVFAEGFAFDNVLGNVGIEGGVASTENLRMKGAAAAVLMAGSTDLARETQDLRVLVVPETGGVGAASLAYALVNPAIGLGTFVAQYLLAKPLAEAGTREFHVTGTWDDPKMERVDRSAPPEPASGAAPSR